MKRNKTYTEIAFDKTFQEKEILDYSFDTRKMGRRDRKIIKLLTKYGINGKSCIDIGPGTGRWLQFLRNNNAGFLASLDISNIALERCKDICDSVYKLDVEKDKYPYDDDKFDIVLSFMILEHLRDPEIFLSEIIRITKHGGIVLMSIPNILSFLSRIRMIFGLMPTAIVSDPTHVKFYNRKTLKKLFSVYKQTPKIVPTSFSLNPRNTKTFRIPTFHSLSSLDDHTLFYFIIKKQ
ncbi:MAG: class I SAM-dependent methyltransferase [Bacteroidales bacterium]|nr:class I SAM-dependent methyltransferase [Bacteroidales bacterium]